MTSLKKQNFYNPIINKIFVDFLHEFNLSIFLKTFDNYKDIVYTLSDDVFHFNPHDKKNSHCRYSLEQLEPSSLNFDFFNPSPLVSLEIFDQSKLQFYKKLVEAHIPNEDIKKIKIFGQSEHNYNNWSGMFALLNHSKYQVPLSGKKHAKNYVLNQHESFKFVFENYSGFINSSTLSNIFSLLSNYQSQSQNSSPTSIASLTQSFIENNSSHFSDKDKFKIYQWVSQTFSHDTKLLDSISHFNSNNTSSIFSDNIKPFTYIKISQDSLLQHFPFTQAHIADNKEYEFIINFLVKSIKSDADKNNELGLSNIFLKNLGIKDNHFLLIIETTEKYNEKEFKNLFKSLLKFYYNEFKVQQQLPSNKDITLSLLLTRTVSSITKNQTFKSCFDYYSLQMNIEQKNDIKTIKSKKI